ncbi:MAG: hypothetical protein ACRDDX_05575 [Cellulosilyticaceae bacterium]
MKNIIVLLLLPSIGIALQVYLSRRKNKWLGLILPVVCIMFSLFAVLGMAAFTSVTTQVTTVTENGEIVEQIVNEEKNEPLMSATEMILSASAIFAIYNIPTLILIGIYVGCREKNKKNLQLQKMNIQDLE